MEATARTPGHPGSTREGRGTGWHVRRLFALAESLTRSAAAASTATASASRASGAGPASAAASASDGANPGNANSETSAETSPAGPGDAGPGDAGPGAAGPGAAGPGAAGPGFGVPVGVDMDALSDAQAVTWAQDLEQLGSFLSALQVQAAGDLAGRVRAGRYDGIKHPSELLAISLKLGRGEAGRRLRLAERFLPATNPLTLVTTAPEQPVTAAAFFSGQLTADQALTASRYTEEARHLADAGRITDDTACEVEETLTGYARTMDPDSLARVGLRTVNTLDPDGQQPTEGELLAKQGITFRQPRRGLVHFEGWATVPQYETWMAGVASAANTPILIPIPPPARKTPHPTAGTTRHPAPRHPAPRHPAPLPQTPLKPRKPPWAGEIQFPGSLTSTACSPPVTFETLTARTALAARTRTTRTGKPRRWQPRAWQARPATVQAMVTGGRRPGRDRRRAGPGNHPPPTAGKIHPAPTVRRTRAAGKPWRRGHT